ncbi:cysteine desulfurase NifS [Paenibacillus sp. J31TS4]|uniref:cysteine desulfurase family protein n=1 Tax=Paenibacillus sp. J31TS4 TaxID=2807195 RepID=UPI001B27C763|nr:cysteine desulfurase family protein [Paenibacillus sp. J31TS4]GIP39250.1 cysteine desulfurase NifS [Paenibacillus sp. J31TS4]
MNRIYLDHAASTPLHPDVLQAMLPVWKETFGNPSSLHAYGREAKAVLDEARRSVARLLKASPRDLIWTSGGTESDNLAVFGVAAAWSARKEASGDMAEAGPGHIVTTSVEHHAVLHACERLEQSGYAVTYLPVDNFGRVEPEAVERALRPDTMLISVMYVNNEVGTVQPIEEIGRIARERGIPFHVDAVQALGHLPIDLERLPVDLLSLSAHKIEGPRGIGVLYCSPKLKLVPQLYGGSQERKRRAGTENVAAAVGFAAALERAVRLLPEERSRMEELRALMLAALARELGEEGFTVNGHPEHRAPHILNVSFPGVSTETMLMNLDLAGIAAASGSACTSGALELSHVLRAMRLSEPCASSAIRFSFGSVTTESDVTKTTQVLGTIIRRLRK